MESRLLFDEKIYSIEALKKAAYKGIAHYSVVIKKEGAQFECLFSFPENTTSEKISKYLDEYKKEVLDQDLRETIKKETEGVRNLILAHAFSKTGLIGDE
jgi:His-Xaa-Ser system protein HxsD